MESKLEDAQLENCIYCGACFKNCVLGVYNGLDGMELKALVSGVTKIARRGYRGESDEQIRGLLDRCTLQKDCDRFCPSKVKPSLRNRIAKQRMDD